MKIQAFPLDSPKDAQIFRVFAEIKNCETDGAYQIKTEEGIIDNVHRAIGCLIEPIAGDKVLVEAQVGGKAYITNVLERLTEITPMIKVQGGLQMRIESGGLQIQSEGGIDLTTLKSLSMTSEQLNIRSDEGNVYFSKLFYIGKSLMSQLESISVLGGIMNSIIDTVVQKSKTSHRVIEETEYVKSRHINHQASHLMQMHGKNTLLSAEELVKLDGDQIHLG